MLRAIRAENSVGHDAYPVDFHLADSRRCVAGGKIGNHQTHVARANGGKHHFGLAEIVDIIGCTDFDKIDAIFADENAIAAQ